MATDPRKKANPKTVNSVLIDRSIRHAIFLQRLAGGEVKDLEKKLPQFRRAVTQVIAPILAQIDGVQPLSQSDAALIDEAGRQASSAAKEFFDQVSSDHIKRLGEIGISEADFEKRLFEKAFPIERNFTVPSDQFIASLLEREPISGKRINKWFTELSSNTRLLVSEQIREGMMEGESINDILRRVRGRREAGFKDGILGRVGDNAKSIVRTGVMKASNRARQAFHEANSDVVKGYQWILTLDDRTCLRCSSKEAQNPYPINNYPEAPEHVNCRCLVSIVTKSWQELGIDLQEAQPGERAAIMNGMKGEVPDTMTYPEWFDRQNASIQQDILGESRYEQYKNGRSVTAFADRGQILTLDELQRIDPI